MNCNWHGRRNQYLFYKLFVFLFLWYIFSSFVINLSWNVKKFFCLKVLYKTLKLYEKNKNGSTLPTTSNTVAKTNLDKYIVSIISKCLSHLISSLNSYLLFVCVLLSSPRDIDNKQTNPIKIY